MTRRYNVHYRSDYSPFLLDVTYEELERFIVDTMISYSYIKRAMVIIEANSVIKLKVA